MYNRPIFIKMYKEVASEENKENDIVKMFLNRNGAQYNFESKLQIFASILLYF